MDLRRLLGDPLVVPCTLCRTISYGSTRAESPRTASFLYPPREYQEKLRRFHGKKVKVLVVIESD